IEYPLLLRLFRVGALKKAVRAASRQTPLNASILATDCLSDDLTIARSTIQEDLQQIDKLANFYARLYRSSTASEFIFTIVAAFVSALTLILLPSIAGASLIAQVVVNFLVLFDAKTRTTQRWQERWLDYRVIAGRLGCIRFMHPLGLGLTQ